MGKDAQDLSKGDEVSWNWSGNKPKGEVQAVHEEDAEIKSKRSAGPSSSRPLPVTPVLTRSDGRRGNPIKKSGSEENPAVEIKQGGKVSSFSALSSWSSPDIPSVEPGPQAVVRAQRDRPVDCSP